MKTDFITTTIKCWIGERPVTSDQAQQDKILEGIIREADDSNTRHRQIKADALLARRMIAENMAVAA